LIDVIVNVYPVFEANEPVTKIDPSRSVFVNVSAIEGEDVNPIVEIGAPLLAPKVYEIVTDVLLARVTELIVGAFGLPAPNLPNPLTEPPPRAPINGMSITPYANLVCAANAVKAAFPVLMIVIE
jgi:hypothetical protein